MAPPPFAKDPQVTRDTTIHLYFEQDRLTSLDAQYGSDTVKALLDNVLHQWQINITGENIKGFIRVPMENKANVVIDLEKLTLSSTANNTFSSPKDYGPLERGIRFSYPTFYL